ncbi:MAG TPA: sulfite exporter TauE/SafE family protein [Gammaproteobacteria bacterium]|nr:sulfite exporter TauE/SafE family protein [Gammaproteobacteria bacterium]
MPGYDWGLLGLIFVMGALYASVGHGGASGYLAAMALFGLAPEVMKPAALVMNVVVAAWVLMRLAGRRNFPWSLFLPIMVPAFPMAFLGGMLHLPAQGYRLLVGIALLVAAARFLSERRHPEQSRPPHPWLAMGAGMCLGFLAGLTGVGGGVYLSPLLLLLGWCTMRDSAAIAAAFILCNSLAGLGGHWLGDGAWPAGMPSLVLAALGGAVIGAELLVRYLPPHGLRRLLGGVLLIAGGKMLLSGL